MIERRKLRELRHDLGGVVPVLETSFKHLLTEGTKKETIQKLHAEGMRILREVIRKIDAIDSMSDQNLDHGGEVKRET